MLQSSLLLQLSFLSLLPSIHTLPTNLQSQSCLSNSICGPQPDSSPIYSNATTITSPWPGNTTGAILNTTTGPPGADDLLFQNLLSAEWIIFSFYQQGIEKFNSTSFTNAGFPNNTYSRLLEIRDNEAGHLRIFQDQISSNSIKPGPCKYKYPYKDAKSYMALQTTIEIASMAFLTGLELQAKLELSRGALVAIASTETRHNTWSLIDIWKTNPFTGPSDTYFPYANQILDFTNEWVIPNSCPEENPIYPSPRQNLPLLSVDSNKTKSITPGNELFVKFTEKNHTTTFKKDEDYFAVFFHGLTNISVPFDVGNLSTVIPQSFEQKGIMEMVIATEEGAKTKDKVVAGPLLLLEQPLEASMALF